jgi:single-stranded-DNA-specific exonuclease
MRRRWVLRRADEAACGRLAAGIAEAQPTLARSARWLATLLANRGLDEPAAALAFLDPTLSRHVRSPLLMTDMRRATMRLADALRGGERIVVFGDYDVDGVSGAAELLLFFRELGVEAGLYVPSRLREGYGLNEGAVRQLAREGARVLVTVDCGTANVRELALAQQLGLDVIVCDHHHAPAERPPACAVLNPQRRDCTFPFKGLSGAGVVFYLLMGLRMELRERGVTRLPDLRRYLDLVALGTVADVVPLVEENRVFVRYGLRELERTRRPGVAALRQITATAGATVQAVGFRLAPVLNAGGRLADARRSVELLTTESTVQARDAAARLWEENRERREIERRMVEEAVAMIEADGQWRRRASIVVGSPAWHPGVVGIVAARLVERYYRPAFVFAVGDTLARGSARSIPGLHLVEALADCREMLASFGGHRAAAGASLRAEDLGRFAGAFERSVRGRTRGRDFIPELEIDAVVSLADVSRPLVEDLGTLEPTGPANPPPTFAARDVGVVDRRAVGTPEEQNGEMQPPHVKLRLQQGECTVDAIGFRMRGIAPAVGTRVDLVFTPERDDWNGNRAVGLRIIDLRPAGSPRDGLK